MSTRHSRETFEQRAVGALFSGGTLFLALFFGAFVGIIALTTVGPAVGVTAGVVVVVLVYGAVFYSNAATTVYATPNALVTESDAPWGTEKRFPFEHVDVVVRKSPAADSLLGTGTYELVRTGGDSEMVWFLRDAERFERLLDERVVDPRQQYRRSDRHTNHFWHLWPDDCRNAIPDSPVVDEEHLEATLDVDLSDVDLGGLDDAVEMHTIDDFGDVDAAVDGSGDAGAFDASGGGAGGDGDGGGGGGE